VKKGLLATLERKSKKNEIDMRLWEGMSAGRKLIHSQKQGLVRGNIKVTNLREKKGRTQEGRVTKGKKDPAEKGKGRSGILAGNRSRSRRKNFGGKSSWGIGILFKEGGLNKSKGTLGMVWKALEWETGEWKTTLWGEDMKRKIEPSSKEEPANFLLKRQGGEVVKVKSKRKEGYLGCPGYRGPHGDNAGRVNPETPIQEEKNIGSL